MRWLAPVITRSPAQESECKGVGRKSAFTPITRSPAQKSACKDLERDGQARAHHAQGHLCSGF
ncbi:hypothetical protein EFO53_03260 [Lacticaseibacillus rhamnosus]|uniref:Malolactic regulator n=1 Tax=Lacticaseibacillus rhamnosus TaxID=47715 RepID=A0AB74IBM1_LACRH|nr:hypothetical protein [Lacticaseibacillus rhamnosus]MCT3151713.1 hypothetical protein [Lacticaseibacillus rhamnosus]MCT3156968.1 hypothetical protein [Lacticaseibacillus rhamnosus]MCT3158380.1 hypothetical protein [Lacticaseibacillus rhamnosus]MCT3186564.1 hypothetical protein [Lacticaseibacillus rhamnosus]